MDSRPTSSNMSLQQMPYEFENSANAYSNDNDKLAQSDLKLTCQRILAPMRRNVHQSGVAKFQCDPPKVNAPAKVDALSDPKFLANLKEHSNRIADQAWKFNAENLSEPAARRSSYPAGNELTPQEKYWLHNFHLTQVVKEKQRRTNEKVQAKQLLKWQPNDVNTTGFENFNHESLDEELSAFDASTGNRGSTTHQVPINHGDVENNAATSTTLLTMPLKHSIHTGIPSPFDTSFVDSAIAMAEFPDDTLWDTEVWDPPSPNPTFSVKEASESDCNFLRSMYCNQNGVGEHFLDAPYDLEGFASYPIDTYPGFPCGSERFSAYDANQSYLEKMQYSHAFPDSFLQYNIRPANSTAVQPGQANKGQMGTANPGTSAKVNAPHVSTTTVATFTPDATFSPDRSAAVGHQLLTDLRADTNSKSGMPAPASSPSIPAESESSSDIIASSSRARLTPYLSVGSTTLPTSRRRKRLPESDSDPDDENSENSLKVLSPSSPSNLTKPGARAVNRFREKAANKITSKDFNFAFPKPATSRMFPSTPVKRPHPSVRNMTNTSSFMSSPFQSTRTPSNTFQSNRALSNTYQSTRTLSNIYQSTRTPSNTFQSNRTPSNTFQSTRTPSNTFQSTRTLSNTFQSTRTLSNTFQSTRTLSNTFQSTRTPSNTFQSTRTPSNTFQSNRTPSNTFQSTRTPSNTFQSNPMTNNAKPSNPMTANAKPSNPINRSRVNLTSTHYGYTTVATPPATRLSNPTTPSSLPPYQSEYSFTTSPTPNGPRFTTILHGQVITNASPAPAMMAAEKEVTKARPVDSRKFDVAKTASEKKAAAVEAAAVKEASGLSSAGEQPAKKKARRAKKNAEGLA